MRQAADVLSSAPAMQIRYLETMQAMAKTANSKVGRCFADVPDRATDIFPRSYSFLHRINHLTLRWHRQMLRVRDPRTMERRRLRSRSTAMGIRGFRVRLIRM